jgi:LmbE family N-acetylglucosaminyl deacetylase
VVSPTLGICVAHPDDETYPTFGSVALHCGDPGFRLVVLHATDGEAGEVAPGVVVGPGGLGAHRRVEDELGWQAVGHVPDRHEWLGYPDGSVGRVPAETLVARVAAFLDEERPDVVVTFGPDGMTGHPDHIAIGRATTVAFHRVRADGGPGLRRLLHPGIPQSRFDAHQEWRVANGFARWEPDRLYHLRGTPDELIGVEVRTRSVSDQVLAGLKAHRSQRHVIFAPTLGDDVWRRQASRETHVIAWPPWDPGAAWLPDVFAGLD